MPAQPRAVPQDRADALPGELVFRQHNATHVGRGDARFAAFASHYELARFAIVRLELTIDDRSVGSMQSCRVGLRMTRYVAVPATDPQTFKPDVSSVIRKADARIREVQTVSYLQIRQFVSGRRGDHHAMLLLVEIGDCMYSAWAIFYTAYRRDIRIVLGFAHGNQMVLPHLEAKRLCSAKR